MSSNIVDLGGKPVEQKAKPSTFLITLRNPDPTNNEPVQEKYVGFLSYTPAFLAVIKNENEPVFFTPYDRVLKIEVI